MRWPSSTPLATTAWATTLLLLSLSPLPTTAQLHHYARKAGLLYYGAATDSPGQRERANLQSTYPQYDAILSDPLEFGQTTPTNGMKWLFTEPLPNVFNFTEGDIVADLAASQQKLLRCHALVWHNQLAPWVESTVWTPPTLRAAITRHITAVATHYKGRCRAWDVVNEALDEDGSYRPSLFYTVLGEDYIKLAFNLTAQIDPAAKLYYNDYGIERPASVKTAGAKRIVKMLKDAGIKIDGVGMQAHLHADVHPTAQDHVDTMQSYLALGVDEVAFTELDVRITEPVNETKLEWQAEAYTNVATACARVKGCVGITLWDFYDPFSWIPVTFPGEGAGLLWFDDFKKHPAHDAVVETFKAIAAANGNGTTPCKNKRKRTVRKIGAVSP
ncbi:glycoside hydrolase superfamily [Bombardia bombarda]|uniref:Beta-xylanase n=1 Tax=Bombardia bombarda TaxID=252184 RepID=A0AA39XM47_9PEZI|nr:glycoside hydrolase superfamily [Bombardia bombarda]